MTPAELVAAYANVLQGWRAVGRADHIEARKIVEWLDAHQNTKGAEDGERQA